MKDPGGGEIEISMAVLINPLISYLDSSRICCGDGSLKIFLLNTSYDTRLSEYRTQRCY